MTRGAAGGGRTAGGSPRCPSRWRRCWPPRRTTCATFWYYAGLHHELASADQGELRPGRPRSTTTRSAQTSRTLPGAAARVHDRDVPYQLTSDGPEPPGRASALVVAPATGRPSPTRRCAAAPSPWSTTRAGATTPDQRSRSTCARPTVAVGRRARVPGRRCAARCPRRAAAAADLVHRPGVPGARDGRDHAGAGVRGDPRTTWSCPCPDQPVHGRRQQRRGQGQRQRVAERDLERADRPPRCRSTAAR